MGGLQFIKTALKDYRVGALTSSSPYTTRKILSYLKPDYRCILEYGPGDGVITKRVLAQIPEDGRVAVFEVNRDFLKELHAIRDPRLTVVDKDAGAASTKFEEFGVHEAHAVISGIPFSFFRPAVREEIVRRTFEVLLPGGVFIVYQYSTLMLPALKRVFGAVKVSFEPRNFPPYFIMVAEK